MSKAEIVAEIPELSPQDRREIMRFIFELEEDAQTLAECDRLAIECFQMLDALEAEEESNVSPSPLSGAAINSIKWPVRVMFGPRSAGGHTRAKMQSRPSPIALFS